ncbi:MAG: hypothetical protein SNH35_05525 [Rikenellaceae bacterium]
MAQNLINQTISLITQSDALRLSEIPDDLLDAWIVGISSKEDYDYRRDFIINIFNEIYEGQKELQSIDAAHEDSDREEYRTRFEQQLRAEKQRRTSGGGANK